MTTANKVTIIRIALVPVFVVSILYYFRKYDPASPETAEIYRWTAIAAFLLATMSDFVDGWLARNRNQQTKLGSYLDPIADKMLLISGLVLLAVPLKTQPFGEPLPYWFVGIVFGRDLIVVAGATLVYLTIGDLTVRPHILSKISSVLQMVCIGWMLFKFTPIVTFWLVIGASVTTAITGVIYVMDGIRQFSEHPVAHPEKKDES